ARQRGDASAGAGHRGAPRAGHRRRPPGGRPPALRRGRDAQARAGGRQRHRGRRPLVGRRRPVRRPRRRRHHPQRPAHLRRHRRPGLRRQLRPRGVPGHHHRAGLDGAGPAAGLPRRVRHLRAALDHRRAPAGHVDRLQRRLGAPQGGPAGGPAGLCDVGRGGRAGALRRARGLHPAGLDRLQPRQRRTGAGVGRGGLRRVVHRSPLADRAGAGGRGRRPHDDQQRQPHRRPGRGARRRPARVRDPGGRGRQRGVRAIALAAGPAARRDLLPPPARALRPARQL
ncbi:MAG: NAD kinase, partial [uncultured Solirubrobacteraceae bacterium]